MSRSRTEPEPTGEPVLLGAISGVTTKPRRRRLLDPTQYLLVLDRGLLLRGIHGRQWWTYVWDSYIGGSRGLDRVVTTPAADLVAHQRTTLLPWSDITRARWQDCDEAAQAGHHDG